MGKFLSVSWETCMRESSGTKSRMGHGTTDWFRVGEGAPHSCILSPCLFNLRAEHIMWNAELGESQAGIKIAGRNINNFSCADDTTLVAESGEELKSVLMRVREESDKESKSYDHGTWTGSRAREATCHHEQPCVPRLIPRAAKYTQRQSRLNSESKGTPDLVIYLFTE